MNADLQAPSGAATQQTELRLKKRTVGDGDAAQASPGQSRGPQGGVSRREGPADPPPSSEGRPHNSRRERAGPGWERPGGSRLGALS
jgi:hypothetical protein